MLKHNSLLNNIKYKTILPAIFIASTVTPSLAGGLPDSNSPLDYKHVVSTKGKPCIECHTDDSNFRQLNNKGIEALLEYINGYVPVEPNKEINNIQTLHSDNLKVKPKISQKPQSTSYQNSKPKTQPVTEDLEGQVSYDAIVFQERLSSIGNNHPYFKNDSPGLVVLYDPNIVDINLPKNLEGNWKIVEDSTILDAVGFLSKHPEYLDVKQITDVKKKVGLFSREELPGVIVVEGKYQPNDSSLEYQAPDWNFYDKDGKTNLIIRPIGRGTQNGGDSGSTTSAGGGLTGGEFGGDAN